MFEGGDLRTFRQIQDLAIPFQKADDRVNIPSKQGAAVRCCRRAMREYNSGL